jgi:hypothetical protein
VCRPSVALVSIIKSREKGLYCSNTIKSNELDKKMIGEVRPLRQRLACSEEEMTSLEHSERRYRHFSEKLPTMIYELDSRGYFVNNTRTRRPIRKFEMRDVKGAI